MCGGQAPATAADALAAVRSGLEFLAAADAATLTLAEQADCVRGLAACESVQLAATARILAAFSHAGGYAADGQASVTSWLRWQTRATPAAAAAAAKWTRRLQAHPGVAAGLAAGGIAPSVAREILDWTDKLPEGHQAGADQVLTGAAAAGAPLADLAGLAEEIYRRCAAPDDGDGDDSFARRRLRLTPISRATPTWTPTSPRPPPRRSRRCWTAWAPGPAPKTTGPSPSATTTPSRKAAAAPSPAGCRPGPGSPPPSSCT